MYEGFYGIFNLPALWYNNLMTQRSILKRLGSPETGFLGIAAALLLSVAPHALADIQLMECVGAVCTIPTSGPLGAFFNYLNLLYPWILGLASGIAILMVLVGGIQIMFSGGDPGKRGAGVERILWALGGMLLLFFSALVLRILNPSFYKW